MIINDNCINTVINRSLLGLYLKFYDRDYYIANVYRDIPILWMTNFNDFLSFFFFQCLKQSQSHTFQ